MASPAASAQDWSIEQREIISVIERCNDGWIESLRVKQWDVFAARCPELPDAVFWYTVGEAPITYGGDDGMWNASTASGNSFAWEQMVPQAVQIEADLALSPTRALRTVRPGVGRAAPK